MRSIHCVGIGGDPVNGTGFIECLAAFEADDQTEAIVMIGEIGGNAEQEAAGGLLKMSPSPSSVSSQVQPHLGKRMGHAGAIISGGKGTAEEKFAAFEAAGIALRRTHPNSVLCCLNSQSRRTSLSQR